MDGNTRPPAKYFRLCDDFQPIVQNANVITFFVRLCGDVLVEVLCFAERRRLTKFERIGRRFHLISKNFFAEIPFLRLSLEFKPGNELIDVIVAYDRIKMLQGELSELPQFLRFNEVDLCYSYIERATTKEKCLSVVNYLQPLKKVLNDVILTHIDVRIDQNYQSNFCDHSQFLDHLRREVLPICDSSRGYKFDISFGSDKSAGANVASSILQMDAIQRSSNLEVNFYSLSTQPLQLPIEEISNWLHRKCDDPINELSEKRSLRIYSVNIQNARELCDHFIKTFNEDNFCLRPYTFRLNFRVGTIGVDDEEIVVTHENTSEELSIRKKKPRRIGGDFTIEIKRGAKKTISKISS